MARARMLWTGPHGSATRDRATSGLPVEPSGLWIAPTPLARAQVARELTRRRGWACGLRVWCWDDLWRAVASKAPRVEPPALLPEAALRAVRDEAIGRARRDGALGPIAAVVGYPGYRRRLRARFAAWTRAERPPGAADPVAEAEAAAYARYREILAGLGAEDREGFAAWASKALHQLPASAFRPLERVVVFDPIAPGPAGWRALAWLDKIAPEILVTLPFDPDPALAEAYAPAAPVRARLLEMGFAETRHRPDLWRPAGLAAVEDGLFRDDAAGSSPAGGCVEVVGAPGGEGLGLVVAAEVADRLARGRWPDDVLVLVPRWDDDAETLARSIRARGIAVAADRDRPLGSDPAVSALRRAIRLPVEGWPAEGLVRLLRNGRLRPVWADGPDTLASASAASAIRASRAFRGLGPIRSALERASADDQSPRRSARARAALAVLEPLAEALARVDRPGTWAEHLGRLETLAGELGLDGPDAGDGVDGLLQAVEDHGAILDGLGEGDRVRSWGEFVAEVDAMAGELSLPAPPPPPGAVTVTTVDRAAGARAACVILANLAEGTFPDRESVQAGPDEGEAEGDGVPSPFAREMFRFLRAVGSADAGLTLAYPTVDAAGQPVLAAGFLDDLLRFLGAEEPGGVHRRHERFDPALMDHQALAAAPADARVRALALACERQPAELARLARSAEHRAVLEATADALELAHRRTRVRAFGPFDGRLSDPHAVAEVGRAFGPERVFSPSQVELYSLCPFQFFLRFVLRLEPVDERDELEVDFAARGSQVHRILEQLEQVLAARAADDPGAAGGPDGGLFESLVEAEAERLGRHDSDVAAGLRQIDGRRLVRSLWRYARQRQDYLGGPGTGAVPHRFEVLFGHDRDVRSLPVLTLGDGDGEVRLQGQIDRVDLLGGDGPARFRVIDYKTGKPPGKKDVEAGLYVQLPLYALAFERHLRAEGKDASADFGYWHLGGKGFAPIPAGPWGEGPERLEAFVGGLVGRLRSGRFAIAPRKDDCARFCDYRTVCRVHQVRTVGKSEAEAFEAGAAGGEDAR